MFSFIDNSDIGKEKEDYYSKSFLLPSSPEYQPLNEVTIDNIDIPISISGSVKNTEEFDKNLIEEKTTKSKTNMNKSNSFQDINSILGQKSSIINNMITNKKDLLSEIEKNSHFLKKMQNNFDEKKKEENNNNKFRLGRKLSLDPTKRAHNKFFEDNIIKKIKGLLLKYLIIFVNSLLNKKEAKLKFLNFNKYVKNIKKDNELELLHKQVKEILSLDISPKNSRFGSNWNAKIIQSILNKDDEKKEIFNFVLNMKFIDFIHLFTLKEKVSNFRKLSKDDCSTIEKKMPKIEDLFDKILNKNQKDELYLAKFIFLLYNYENWFLYKIGRNKNPKIKIK